MMRPKTPPVNPYARSRPPLAQNVEMGRQSQQRVSNTKRAFQLAASNSFPKKKKGGQKTLQGGLAFEPERDCQVCKAQLLAKFLEGVHIPKRPHHVLCIKNTKTRGKGRLSEQTLATQMEEKRLQSLYSMPLKPHKKGSYQHLTKEAGDAFFAPRKTTVRTPTSMKEDSASTIGEELVKPINLCKAVSTMVSDPSFQEKHKNKVAPLAMLAFATEVVDKIVRSKAHAFGSYFDGLTMVIPSCYNDNNPHYHSIVGQKLLLVDWSKTHGIEVPCPDAQCPGKLDNDRTNFSKNKTLFPIFGLEGPPSWCMVMSMVCTSCKRRFNSNDGEVLLSIPDYAAASYPVDTKYALSNKSFHINHWATEVFDSIMVTYANGELCSKLLFNTMNRAYIRRLKIYYSYVNRNNPEVGSQATDYVEKDGEFIKQFPPLGDTICDMYDEGAKTSNNPWGISDNERNSREIQAVTCGGAGIFAQDHTFEAVKNYQKRLGAKAVWDVATETGEIAAAVLVPTTKIRHFAHAAQQLVNRNWFSPSIMYSDTWPHKSEFWGSLIDGVEGRLGLFHYEKCILRTLRKKHVDYFDAIGDLLSAVYSYCPDDYERLLRALKNGSLSATGKCFTTEEIADLKGTKLFRDRYGKYLRKTLRPTQTMIQNLDDWFCKYKVTSSNSARPARGRLDPFHQVPLFTQETKDAVENCKEKAAYLADPLPLDQMYDEILPNPNSKHGLTEYLSKRGESKLEAFHDRFAHFANSGMRDSLADSLNLSGTARYNLAIRHKRALIIASNENAAARMEERSKIPGAWEKIPPFSNHTELNYVNAMAKAIGVAIPFPKAEQLPEDTGERFFSEYLTVCKPLLLRYDDKDLCQCSSCIIPLRAKASVMENVVAATLQPPPIATLRTVTTADNTGDESTSDDNRQQGAGPPTQQVRPPSISR